MHDKIIVLNERRIRRYGDTSGSCWKKMPDLYDIAASQLSKEGTSMKKTFSSLKRLARYIRPYRGTFLLVILFTVLTVAFNVACHMLQDFYYRKKSVVIIAQMANQSIFLIYSKKSHLDHSLGRNRVLYFANAFWGFDDHNVVSKSMHDLRSERHRRKNPIVFRFAYFDNKNQARKIFCLV